METPGRRGPGWRGPGGASAGARGGLGPAAAWRFLLLSGWEGWRAWGDGAGSGIAAGLVGQPPGDLGAGGEAELVQDVGDVAGGGGGGGDQLVGDGLVCGG